MFELSTIGQDFSAAANEYDSHAHLQRDVREHALKLATPYWQAASHILDVGCGTGSFAASAKHWQITGVDLAFGMCRKAATRQAVTINASADALPFIDGHFDGVFSSLMLQWAIRPERELAEMARVLKRGGTAVVATLVEGTLAELQESFATIDDTPHVSYFPQAHLLQALARSAGFSVVLSEKSTVTQQYDDIRTLMQSIRAIGAANKQAGRKRGMMTPSQLTKLEEAYRNAFAIGGQLPLSWQLVYFVLKKA